VLQHGCSALLLALLLLLHRCASCCCCLAWPSCGCACAQAETASAAAAAAPQAAAHHPALLLLWGCLPDLLQTVGSLALAHLLLLLLSAGQLWG
jgi:hypothetical protein